VVNMYRLNDYIATLLYMLTHGYISELIKSSSNTENGLLFTSVFNINTRA